MLFLYVSLRRDNIVLRSAPSPWGYYVNGFTTRFKTGYNVKKINQILKQVQDDRGDFSG